MKLTITDWAAWWGAIVASLILAWDIIKWKTSGPKLRLTVGANQKTINVPGRDDKIWVSVRAENIGDAQTTITNMGLGYYKSRAHKIFKKHEQKYIVTIPDVRQPIPYVIEPGRIWDGLAEQTKELEEMARNGYLEVEIYCANFTRPICKQVVFKK